MQCGRLGEQWDLDHAEQPPVAKRWADHPVEQQDDDQHHDDPEDLNDLGRERHPMMPRTQITM